MSRQLDKKAMDLSSQVNWFGFSDDCFFAGEHIGNTIVQMIAPLLGVEQVVVVVASTAKKEKLLSMLSSYCGASCMQMEGFQILEIPHQSIWLRDTGPHFVNRDGRWSVVQFQPNRKRYPSTSVGSEDGLGIHQIAANRHGATVHTAPIVAEGGNWEINSRGTMIALRSTELRNNPGWTTGQLEEVYADCLGVKEMIWLQDGLAESTRSFYDKSQSYLQALPKDQFVIGPGGHMDEFCRFVDDSTILLSQVSPSERKGDPSMEINFEGLEASLQILKQARDHDGNPFRILRAPVGPRILSQFQVAEGSYFCRFFREDGSQVKAGERVTQMVLTSYLNYVTTTKFAFIPQYWKQGRDAAIAAKDQYMLDLAKHIFPGKTIVPIHPEPLNHGGGGIHCLYQSVPSTQEPSIDKFK